MVGKKAIDEQLYNKFLLDEIKVKNDALKQLLSINALLMAGYATILFNIDNKITVSDGKTYFSLIKYVVSFNPNTKAFNTNTNVIRIVTFIFKSLWLISDTLAVILLLLVLVGPIILWILSMNYAMKSFTENYHNESIKSEDSDVSRAHFKNMSDKKNSIYVNCYLLTMSGILLVALTVIISVFFKVFA